MKLAISIVAIATLVSSAASAQFYGGGQMGYRPAAVYPSDPNYSIGAVQQRGYALSMRARQQDLATDCTDYGYGDCRERMARSNHPYGPGWAITGAGGGYGGQPGYGGGYYGRPVQPGWGYQSAGYGYGGRPIQPGWGGGYGGGWGQPGGYIVQRRVYGGYYNTGYGGGVGYGAPMQRPMWGGGGGSYYRGGYGYGNDPFAMIGAMFGSMLRAGAYGGW